MFSSVASLDVPPSRVSATSNVHQKWAYKNWLHQEKPMSIPAATDSTQQQKKGTRKVAVLRSTMRAHLTISSSRLFDCLACVGYDPTGMTKPIHGTSRVAPDSWSSMQFCWECTQYNPAAMPDINTGILDQQIAWEHQNAASTPLGVRTQRERK